MQSISLGLATGGPVSKSRISGKMYSGIEPYTSGIHHAH